MAFVSRRRRNTKKKTNEGGRTIRHGRPSARDSITRPDRRTPTRARDICISFASRLHFVGMRLRDAALIVGPVGPAGRRRLFDPPPPIASPYPIGPHFNHLYHASSNFTEFYWLLLGFTGFHRVLLSFARFYWVLLSFARFQWVSLGFTGFFIEIEWGFVGFGSDLIGLHFLPSFFSETKSFD